MAVTATYLTLRPLIQSDIPKIGSLTDRIPKSDRKIDAVCFCDLGTTSDMIGRTSGILPRFIERHNTPQIPFVKNIIETKYRNQVVFVDIRLVTKNKRSFILRRFKVFFIEIRTFGSSRSSVSSFQ